MLRVGYYQFRPVFGDVVQNRERVLKALARVKADLIVLPELAFTGYSFKSRLELVELAEDPERSLTVEALVGLCCARDLHVVTGFAERAKGKLYNTALLLGPRGILQSYRKLHLFNKEKLYFDAGNRPLGVTKVKGVKVGVMICFDYVFPEAARRLSLDGAEIICHPSNLVTRYGQAVMQTRAIENGVFTVTANRIGKEQRAGSRLRFTGASQIVSPCGELLSKAPAAKASLQIVPLDPEDARNKHFTPLNHLLLDRRPRFYER